MSVVGLRVSNSHRGSGGAGETHWKFRLHSGGHIARVVGLRAQSFWLENLGGGAGGCGSRFEAFLQGVVVEVVVRFWF